MRISRAGIFVLIAFTVLIGTGCGKIIARKNLVDGAQAYKDRKFDQAEALFRDAVSRDPEQNTAQLFLARTLHSQYAADRQRVNKAEEAITQYKKTIEEYKKTVAEKNSFFSGAQSPCGYSDYEIRKMPGEQKAAFDSFKILGDSLKAVANLLDNLQKADERIQWLNQWGEDASLPACLRAEAYNSLAAKENTCANDVTEDPAVKKTVTKDGKSTFTFSKPEKPEDLEKLRGCVQRGTELINKAAELEPNSDSIWSYKTSLLIQNMRLAEMDGRVPDKDRYKNEADQAKVRFTELAKAKKEKADREEAAIKAAAEEAEGNANTNTNTAQ
jgi:peptidoglycan hydrolase CwlO-like protein